MLIELLKIDFDKCNFKYEISNKFDATLVKSTIICLHAHCHDQVAPNLCATRLR